MARPARVYLPELTLHIRRTAFLAMPLLARPGAAAFVISQVRMLARKYKVHLHAIAVYRNSYEMLVSVQSSRGMARFLCKANQSIAVEVRPKGWTSTFWDGDRPTVTVLTAEEECHARQVRAMFHGVSADLLRRCRQAGPDVLQAVDERPGRGRVLGLYLSGLPGWAGAAAEDLAGRAQGLLDAVCVDDNRHGNQRASRLPGTKTVRMPKGRYNAVAGRDLRLLAALAARWHTFQATYRKAAPRLENLRIDLGFPRHAFGPPFPIPPYAAAA